MPKKFLTLFLASMLLASCVSISGGLDAPVQEQDFVTATLAPTQTETVPAVSTVPPTMIAPTLTATVPPNCTIAAVLLRDVTIPDYAQVEASGKFTKTWEFQNIGTCPWINFTVKFLSGDEIHAPLTIPMPAAVPKEKVLLSMEFTAPAANGSYSGYFTLLDPQGRTVPIGAETSFWLKFRVGAVASIPVNPGAAPVQPGDCIRSPNAGYVNEILSLINAARGNAGLPALAFNAEMAAFAQSHSEDMAYNNFLSHDGSDGSFGERMAAYNQTHSGYGIFGEILAIGTPQEAMSQWGRDEHWNFIMAENTQIGAGYAYSSCSDYGGYFTVDFGY